MKTSYTYDHYYTFAEIEGIFRNYVKEFPTYAKMTSLNKTEEGRDIWMLELTDTSTGDYDAKPAYCVLGHVHASEITGSMCAMYFLDTIFTGIGKDPKVDRILKDYTIYVVPRPTPDGTEFFLNGYFSRSVNKFWPPIKELPDGIYAKDLDGDGVVRFMRIRDPNGPWKKVDFDDRIMERRSPDEFEGEYYSVFVEGEVKGDPKKNLYNAPVPYGHDFNRSFPVGWQPNYIQDGSGPYPLYNIETRTLADLFIRKTNICSVQSFHTAAGMMFYGPGHIPSKQAPKEDMNRYLAMGAMLTEETGYPAFNLYDNMTRHGNPPSAGGIDDYINYCRGIACTSLECWDLDIRIDIGGKWERDLSKLTVKKALENSYNLLKWIDENCPAGTCKPWTPFEHPQLGQVEIGGYDTRYVEQNPPVNLLPQEVEKVGRFMYRQIDTMPRVYLKDVTAEKLGDGMFEITASARNNRFFPTYVTAVAKQHKMVDEDRMYLIGDGIEFVSGKQKENIGFIDGMSAVSTRGVFDPYQKVGSGNITIIKTIRWVVKADDGAKIKIRYESDRAGCDEREIVLG